jgi:YjbE family integral membrane protein
VSAQLDPSFWLQLLQEPSGAGESATFWLAVLRIVAINIFLSGDNAVVIAMACRGLPRSKRLWGLVIGVSIAVILLILFTGFVAWLIKLPYLKAAGGLALLFIGAKLIVPEDDNKTQTHADAHLWRAVRVIAAADLVMSFDNSIAVATAARGNVVLLAIGLAVSIPIIIAGAALFLALLDRFPILLWIGAGLLGWVAGEAIVTDRAISVYLAAAFGEEFARGAGWVGPILGALVVIIAGGLWRRMSVGATHSA